MSAVPSGDRASRRSATGISRLGSAGPRARIGGAADPRRAVLAPPGDGGLRLCSIVAGTTPAHLVLEDETCIAFLDARPLFPGHTLVVPRLHRATLREVPRAELEPLMHAAQRVSLAFEPALGAQGTFVALNDRVSQERVPHVHLHVVPRRKGDGLRGFFWPRHKYASDEEAAAVAAKLQGRARVVTREPDVRRTPQGGLYARPLAAAPSVPVRAEQQERARGRRGAWPHRSRRRSSTRQRPESGR